MFGARVDAFDEIEVVVSHVRRDVRENSTEQHNHERLCIEASAAEFAVTARGERRPEEDGHNAGG